MIDQLSFTNSCFSASSGPMVPVIKNYQSTIENIFIGMYPFLMRNFNFFTTILSIYSTSNGTLSSSNPVSFRTTYLSDPRTLPSPVEYGKGNPSIGMDMSLFAAKVIF